MKMRLDSAVRMATRFMLHLERYGLTSMSPVLIQPQWGAFLAEFFSEITSTETNEGLWKRGRDGVWSRSLSQSVTFYFRGQMIAYVELKGREDKWFDDQGQTRSIEYWGVKHVLYANRFDLSASHWVSYTFPVTSEWQMTTDGKPFGCPRES